MQTNSTASLNISLFEENRSAFYSYSIITEFWKNGSEAPKSYWVETTSGMFPRPVPTSGAQRFVRHDFLGLIISWGPVRYVTYTTLARSYLVLASRS